ncbi:hypothetical protein FRC04_004878 [Tulasnella sp. 424]|nr:hypothetical protein FRC04_004878 [Tulasnella sp. 424]
MTPYFFAQPVDVDIRLEGEENRKQAEVKLGNDRKEAYPVITMESLLLARFAHAHQLFYDRGNHYEFLPLSQELAAPGELRQAQTFDFNFKNVEKQYESYQDVIVGKIYFLLVRIKIKHMEISIIRRETTGAVPIQYNDSETITKFEIMDGAPVRGETISIRLFLGGFPITPTFRDVNKGIQHKVLLEPRFGG